MNLATNLPSGSKAIAEHLASGAKLTSNVRKPDVPSERAKRADRKFKSNAERQAAYRNRKIA
jgi:hypothetical protein